MDTSDDKDMLMRQLAIFEFGCRNTLYLLFESLSESLSESLFESLSLSVYCLYQKRLAEKIPSRHLLVPVQQWKRQKKQ